MVVCFTVRVYSTIFQPYSADPCAKVPAKVISREKFQLRNSDEVPTFCALEEEEGLLKLENLYLQQAFLAACSRSFHKMTLVNPGEPSNGHAPMVSERKTT